MDENSEERYLIKLSDSKQQTPLQVIKKKMTQFAKYFFDTRSNTVLIYDRSCIFIVSKQQTKITDLGKIYPIAQLVYNPFRNIIVFLTFDGDLFGHFISHKTQILIKKNVKADLLFDWIYGRQAVQFFIADYTGVKLFKIDEEKKIFKEVKSVNAKYNSFLYDPLSQVLAGFPVGDCKTVYTFIFDDESKQKNWFKGPQIGISFDHDAELMAQVKKTKSLGMKNSRIHSQLFSKQIYQDHAADLIRMNSISYLVLYFSNQGKLKLYPIAQQTNQKEIFIKLPSDSVPIFHVVDNMLVIHLRNQRITFIYDVWNSNAQMLVSPFPLEHSTRKQDNFYDGSFKGRRHIMPNGVLSKWVINIPVIHHYLKNQTQIFQFLLRRRQGKSQNLRWLRQNLTKFKQVNLSRFWKMIFLKYLSPDDDDRDNITLGDIYANIFYTLAHDGITPRKQLMIVILQCLRQANQLKLKIHYELQKLLLQLLLEFKRYDLLVFLCHNDIIKDSQQFADLLIKKGQQQNEQILITLSIDMANRACKPQKVFQLLMQSQKIWQARRYLKFNYQTIDILFMIYSAKLIRDLNTRREYIRLTRYFIQKKFPSITQKYLDQAEVSVRIQSTGFSRQSLR